MSIRYLDIQRMSSEDGPGLRTTVFFKGCSLACRWCHNPESISPAIEMQWLGERCIGCGTCQAACPNGAVSLCVEGVFIDETACARCGACREACPTCAMTQKGTDVPFDQLALELYKDRAYFGADGGVTLSGGEALLQSDSIPLLRQLKKMGLHTAVDTCGLVPNYRLLQALGHTDVLLYDVKIFDPVRHRAFTGQSNELILNNLSLAADWAKHGGRLWVRTPIIPIATDFEANIEAIGRLLHRLGGVERWELIAFNNLCRDTYRRMQRDWEYENTPLVTKQRMETLLFTARATGGCPDTRITGATRQEADIP